MHTARGSGRLGLGGRVQPMAGAGAEGASQMVRQYCVEGRVQGVGFRWFVHREAAALGLHGSVRNTEGGAVEVVASGSADTLALLRRTLEQGPRGSRVDRVSEMELPPDKAEQLDTFKIEGAW